MRVCSALNGLIDNVSQFPAAAPNPSSRTNGLSTRPSPSFRHHRGPAVPDPGVQWIAADALGTPNAWTDCCTLVGSYRAHPWGWTAHSSGIQGHYWFADQLEQFSWPGYFAMGARSYDHHTHTFVQPDPVIPDLRNPQTLNRYAYALNNPLRYVDPSGHVPEAPAHWPETHCVGRYTHPSCGLAPEEEEVLSQTGGAFVVESGFASGVLLGATAGRALRQLRLGSIVDEGAFAFASGLIVGFSAFAAVSPDELTELASRARDLQEALPPASRGRVVMAAGIVEAPDGRRFTIIASSEPGRYLRPGVKALHDLAAPGEWVAEGPGHAESKILSYLDAINQGPLGRKAGYRVVAIAAGRAVCPACAADMAAHRVTLATPIRRKRRDGLTLDLKELDWELDATLQELSDADVWRIARDAAVAALREAGVSAVEIAQCVRWLEQRAPGAGHRRAHVRAIRLAESHDARYFELEKTSHDDQDANRAALAEFRKARAVSAMAALLEGSRQASYSAIYEAAFAGRRRSDVLSVARRSAGLDQ